MCRNIPELNFPFRSLSGICIVGLNYSDLDDLILYKRPFEIV